MNEQKQAEVLAAWLEDANSPPSEAGATGALEGLEELDADVQETLLALRPEFAPAPRVSVEDILASVTEGPLAEAPSKPAMPVGASVGAAPEDAPLDGSSRSRRPWFYAVLGMGGVGSLVAAAALLLVVGTVAVNTPTQDEASAPVAQDRGSLAAPAPMRDAVAMEEAEAVDTGGGVGVGVGDADAARRPSRPRTAAARPRPKPSPRPVSPSPTTPDAQPMPAEEPDAVAFADDLDLVGGAEGGDVFDGSLEELGYLDAPADGLVDEDVARTIPEVPRGGLARDLADSTALGRGSGKGSGRPAMKESPSEEKSAPKAEDPRQTRAAAEQTAKRAEQEARPAKEERRAQDEIQDMEETMSVGAAAPPTARPSTPRQPANRGFDAGPSMDDSVSVDPGMNQPVMAPEADSESRRRIDTESADRNRNSPLFGRRKKAKQASQAPAAPEAEPAAEAEPPPAAAAPPPPPPADTRGSRAQQARQGVESTTSPEIRAAQAALDANTPRVALDTIDAALGASPSTAVKQHLLALKGDALMALGDRSGAEAAWDAAIALQTGP